MLSKLITSIFITILIVNAPATFAGATPPPPSWNPTYTANILVFADNSAVIKGDFKQFAEAKVSHLNSVLKQSHANVKFKLVGTRNINYKVPTLGSFKYDPYVVAEKKKTNAHIAYLFSDLDFAKRTCGRGYISTSNDWGFSVGRVKSSYCNIGNTFVHEIGHNLGLYHVHQDAPSSRKYAAGKAIWAWVTMMPYGNGRIKKQRFSNPYIKCDAFYSCGDENNGNAVRRINETAGARFNRNF